MVYSAIDIERLNVGERLLLIEQVWDSRRRRAGVRRILFRPQARAEIREARSWYEGQVAGLARAFIAGGWLRSPQASVLSQ